MKKFYTKPTAELVDFSLSSSIATTCDPGSGTTNNGWEVAADEHTCKYSLDGVCYHVPNKDTSVFNS